MSPISPESIRHAKSLSVGMRVRAKGPGLEGTGEIVAEGHDENRFGFIPIWLCRMDHDHFSALYPVFHDELEPEEAS